MPPIQNSQENSPQQIEKHKNIRLQEAKLQRTRKEEDEEQRKVEGKDEGEDGETEEKKD